MGEPDLIAEIDSEPALAARAAQVAQALHAARIWPLTLGLSGDLGSGKTTWVRAMLRGLGYSGRVPSPTYTLLEHYAIGGLEVVHLDLYRLRGDAELENLGARDWFREPGRWLLVEWPERALELAQRCDLTLRLEALPAGGRRLTWAARTPVGLEALRLLNEAFNNEP
jgi:tRNA threonylcarbamoyladenosine biosynthesis protein TsaE